VGVLLTQQKTVYLTASAFSINNSLVAHLLNLMVLVSLLHLFVTKRKCSLKGRKDGRKGGTVYDIVIERERERERKRVLSSFV
jgi:hypothetical protein